MRTLLWFRRNLRVHDQPLFRVDEAAVGVWILDPREILTTDPPAASHVVARTDFWFLLESVADLRSQLRGLGSELIVRVGEPETVLAELAQHLEVATVRTIEEPGTEERTTERAVAKALPEHCVFERMPPETLFEFDDPEVSRELPEVFSKFRRTSGKREHIGVPLPTPTSLHAFSIDVLLATSQPFTIWATKTMLPIPKASWPSRWRDGRSGSGGRLDLHRRSSAAVQSATASWVRTIPPSSHRLALGCISSRQVAAETLRYEQNGWRTTPPRIDLAGVFSPVLVEARPRLFRRGGQDHPGPNRLRLV